MHKDRTIWTCVLWRALMDCIPFSLDGHMFLWQTIYHFQCCQDLTSSVAFCGGWCSRCPFGPLDKYPYLCISQTHSCWTNEYESNESALSLCYQCDPGQVLWHHQHLRGGAARCNDRRSRNGHIQRVSMHVSIYKLESKTVGMVCKS